MVGATKEMGATGETTRLGERLRKGRRASGRTIEDLAPTLGVNKNTLAAYERGERLPDVDFLAVFAARTGVPFLELLILRLRDSQAPEAAPSADMLAQLTQLPYRVGAPETASECSDLPPPLIDQEILQATDEFMRRTERDELMRFQSPEDRYKVMSILYKMYFYARETERQPWNARLTEELTRLQKQLNDTWPRAAARG